MTTRFRAKDHPKSPESEYGSDFSVEEESIVLQLLERIQNSSEGEASTSAIQHDPVLQVDLNAAFRADLFVPSPLEELTLDRHHGLATSSAVGRGLQGDARAPAGRDSALRSADGRHSMDIRSMPMDGVEYPDLSRVLSNLGSKTTPPEESKVEERHPAEHKRSPIERFRSSPKRLLSVSDISAGAWCELQYWYTLTRLPGGRKTRTAAMKGGTKVHKTLEDQVHTTVRVDVSLKEEAFALRLRNFIQGLRMLRDTGLTRELEVWGLVEGQVINGVIDELSYASPNLGFEEELSQSQSSQDDVSGFVEKQSTITKYFDPQRERVYLTDVKTRGSAKLPSGAAVRPSRVQLSLYHRLLGDMAAGRLDFATIVARYGLRPDVRFSDAFMAQIGSLHDEVFDEVEPGEDALLILPNQMTGTDRGYPDPFPGLGTETSPPPDLIGYRSIQQMIPLVQSELRETFPQGARTIDDLAAIVYRHRDDGRVLGNKIFRIDAKALSDYLKLDLSWWLGKRNPDGVPIEEAYKCRICEFAESCEWRKERDEAIVRKSRRQTDRGLQN